MVLITHILYNKRQGSIISPVSAQAIITDADFKLPVNWNCQVEARAQRAQTQRSFVLRP